MISEQDIKNCSEKLYKLCDEVERLNSLNYYDINISCENFYMRILNIIYGWNLNNINDEINNAKAIDLYDDEKRIAVQVTSDDSATKIHNTIKKHIDDNLHLRYDRLIIIVIVKNKKYSANFQNDSQDKFVFDETKDIITCKKLINDISSLDPHKINELSKYLNFELGTILDSRHVWSIEQANNYISNCTKNILNLDYFEIDDKNFIDSFENQIKQKHNIYIDGYSKEETLYCVLNQIQKIGLKAPVFIIRNSETWADANKYINDSILIPYFYAEEIPAVKNNINIFVYGIDRPCKKSNKISLRRRTRSFLEEKLRKNGYNEPNKLLTKTNGIFAFLKRKLFEGQPEDPAWIRLREKPFLIALLLGKWSESQGDIEVIEELCEIQYDQFIDFISEFINSPTPFIVKINDFGKIIYKLADAEIAWAYIYHNVTEKLKLKFISLAERIVTEKDPLFDKPFDTHFQASITSEKSKYSNEIKHGIIKSLIFIAINGSQCQIDNCINNILSKVTSLNDWGYISQFFETLCEASPSIIINRLESEIKNNTGLLDMFTAESKNSFGGRHYYTHILWAVEHLLLCKQYTSRATLWLMDLGNLISECSTGNNPRSTLSDIFCTWHNISTLSTDDKIQLAEIGVNKYPYLWNIIYNQLPGKHTHIITSTAKFDYREYDEKAEVTNADIGRLNIQYFELLTLNIENNVDKWCKMLDVLTDIPDNLYDDTLLKLIESIKFMHDKEKEKIKTDLRKFIHRHRYFAKSFWAMDESRLLKIEELCKSIKFEDKIYDFLYLKTPTYDFPLYNPTIMEKETGTNSRDENEIKIEEQLLHEFARFKKLNLDLQHFLELINLENYTNLGSNIAKYYSNGKYNEETLKLMLNVQGISNIIIEYIRYCYYNDSFEVITNVLQLIDNYENNNTLYVSVLEILPLTSSNITLLEAQTDEIKKEYWQQHLRFYGIDNKQVIYYVLNNSQKYKSCHNLLMILYEARDYLLVDEIIKYLKDVISIVNEKKININNEDTWHIEEIMQTIHNNINGNYEKYLEVMSLELILHKVIQWNNMKCTQYIFKTNAKSYAEIIGIVLKNGSGIEPTKEKLEAAQNLFSLYYDAKFCPGEIENKIDKNVLSQWILNFKNCLSSQYQDQVFTLEIGRLFAYSPVGNDGYYPHEFIRDVIEEIYDDQLCNSYCTSTYNRRGVHYCDDGKSEKELAIRYKENADKIRIKYPKTAEIYDKISQSYFAEADAERERAENGRW